jgi:hypothetical protein
MGLTPEKQDHSAVVEPSLVRAMALLEAVVEKGVMRDNRVLVELVDSGNRPTLRQVPRYR